MAEFLMDSEWSRSGLGQIEHWPQCLKTSLGIMLHAPAPMLLFWGLDLTCFYNDAFHAKFFNSSPPVIGKSGKVALSGNWNFILRMAEQVILTGNAVSQEDVLAPSETNGMVKNIYCTFTNCPVFNENGEVSGALVYCQETTGNVKASQAIQESERRFRDLADQVPMLVWMVNEKATITYANRTLLHLLQVEDYREVSVQGGWERVTHPEDITKVFEAFSDGLTRQKEYAVEARLLNRINEKYEWFLFQATPRFLNNGEFAGFIGTAINVDELKTLQARLENIVQQRTNELEISNNQLRRSNAELEQFAYVASHDLQEPLRKIQTFSNLIKQRYGDELSESIIVYLDKVESSASRMADLIKDLLDYSRLSFGTAGSFTKVDLNKILRNVLDDFEVLIAQKKITLYESDLSVIDAIPLQMNQLFYNLIGNSIKFSRTNVESFVSVREAPLSEEVFAQLNLKRDRSDYIQLIFEDNGIGFSEAYADQIFTIFQRLNDKSIYKGYGIGLALCRKIVDNHQGQITATAKVNEGATFSVILPKKRNPEN